MPAKREVLLPLHPVSSEDITTDTTKARNGRDVRDRMVLRPNFVMENWNANRAHGRGVAWYVAGLVPKVATGARDGEFSRRFGGDRSKLI